MLLTVRPISSPRSADGKDRKPRACSIGRRYSHLATTRAKRSTTAPFWELMPMTRRPSLPRHRQAPSGRSADPLAGIGVGGIEAVVRLEPAESVGWTIPEARRLIASSTTPPPPLTSSKTCTRPNDHQRIPGPSPARLWRAIVRYFYVGYGRCFTGDAWQRDSFRAELRLIF